MKRKRHPKTKCSGSRSPGLPVHRCGFSLLELIVVLAVATILTGLLLPAMGKLRENVNRVVCSSNLRQIGIGFVMFVDDNNERMPGSAHLIDRYDGPWRPEELMSVHSGNDRDAWDGLGVLFDQQYCGSAECFYCPSHRGDHSIERYAEHWENPGRAPIYINFHYAGNRSWETGMRRLWQNPERLVIATDGLRSAKDFNHESGMNVLYGDASVRWRSGGDEIMMLLPSDANDGDYSSIWRRLQGSTTWD